MSLPKIVVPEGLAPEKEAEGLRLIAKHNAIAEANPFLFYKPHAKQRDFHGAKAPEDITLFVRGFLGGNQSGKTTAGLADDIIQAVDEEALPEHLVSYKRFHPPFKCRIFTPDLTKTGKGSLYEKLKELLPKDQLVKGSWEKAFDKEDRKLNFKNGSWFDFLSYEQDEDKFGGITLDRVHFDEEPPGEKGRRIYNQARMRVMARKGDLIFTMTPELGMSWMFDEIFERRLDPDIHITQVATDENTYLDRNAVDQAFASMTDEEQDAKRKGRFVAFGGLVVQVEKERHVIPRPDPSHVRGLENYVVIDPGAAQGAVLFGGFDREDSLLVWDELYPSGHPQTIVSNVCEAIFEKLADWGVKKSDVIFVVDPSARNRTVDGGAGVEQAYWEQGVFPIHGKNNRRASVMQLRRRAGADRKLLLISEECRKLLWELGRWRVAEDETSDKVKRDQTGDSFATAGPDHLADCLRYMAMERVYGPVMQDSRSAFQAWVPDQAPPQEWFQQRSGTDSAPMGRYS